MEFIQESNRFYHQNEEGKLLAEITWQKQGDILFVDHTFTDPSLRGQGIAGRLVDKVTEYARREGLSIMPICPYVVRKFDEDSQFEDVDYRRKG